jgi:hypothetical protein
VERRENNGLGSRKAWARFFLSFFLSFFVSLLGGWFLYFFLGLKFYSLV